MVDYTNNKIDIPFVPQKEADECVIACALMIFKWARNELGDDIPKFDYDDIKRILKREIDLDGVPLSAFRLLNRYKTDTHTRVRISFQYSLSTGLAEIEKEIRERRPIITWLQQEIDGKEINHSVVVIGVSEDRMTIYYLDPNKTEDPIMVPTTRFLDDWGGTDYIQIRIAIIKSPQTSIPEYYSEEST